MRKARILVVEDEKDIAELIQYNLEREGYTVKIFSTAEEALNILKTDLPDLILLDLMLPGLDGLETCRLIKQDNRTSSIPIIMLTAKSEESDVVVGLQMGADDYIAKPFSPRILIARVKTILRRFAPKDIPQETRSLGPFLMHILKHKVTFRNKPIELTTIEFNILEFLSRHPGRVFSRDQILDQAWSEGKFIVDRAVDVHIRSLRKKFKEGAGLIETVRGVGYRFKETDEKS